MDGLGDDVRVGADLKKALDEIGRCYSLANTLISESSVPEGSYHC